MGGGNREWDGTGRGRCVLLDATNGELLQEFPYKPVDQAEITYRDGQLAWASADGVHLLGDLMATHPGSGVGGSLYEVVPADGGFLTGMNGGFADGKYTSGLTLFNADKAESWLYDGWVPALGWAAGHAVGYSYQGLDGREAQLTILNPGDRQGQAVGRPLGEGAILWSFSLGIRGEEVIAIVSDEELQPTVLRTSMATGEAVRVPMSGENAIWGWHLAGDGPTDAYLSGDCFVWRHSSGLYATNVDTGVTEPRPSPDFGGDGQWWLQPETLVRVDKSGQDYSFAAWEGDQQLTSITTKLDGPSDQICWAAAYLPPKVGLSRAASEAGQYRNQ